jgi:hypothetical protein
MVEAIANNLLSAQRNSIVGFEGRILGSSLVVPYGLLAGLHEVPECLGSPVKAAFWTSLEMVGKGIEASGSSRMHVVVIRFRVFAARICGSALL